MKANEFMNQILEKLKGLLRPVFDNGSAGTDADGEYDHGLRGEWPKINT